MKKIEVIVTDLDTGKRESIIELNRPIKTEYSKIGPMNLKRDIYIFEITDLIHEKIGGGENEKKT